MQDPALIGLLVLLGAFVGSRFVSERALATLTSEEKVRVLDAFAAQRKYSILVVVALVLVVLTLGSAVSSAVFFALLGAYVVGLSVYAFAKMRRLALPASYVRSFVASQLLQLGGLAVYFATLSGVLSE